MRLHACLNQSSVSNEDFGDFEVDDDGTVEVPEAFGVYLNSTYIGGKIAWETESQHHARRVAEEADRRKDPATLLAAVEALTSKVADAPAKRAPRKAAAK